MFGSKTSHKQAVSSTVPSGPPTMEGTRVACFPYDSEIYQAKSKSMPFTETEILNAAYKYPTPFHIYNAKLIKTNYRKMKEAFKWVDTYNGSTGKDGLGFCNYFAVKATPNPEILMLLDSENSAFDCSSMAELELCDALGFRGSKVMLSSNNTTLRVYEKAKQMQAFINIDDISHIDFIHDNIGLPNSISFRFNPGKARVGNLIIGKPEEAKFGLTREQLFKAFQSAKDKGVQEFGLHTMVVSNCIDIQELAETANMMFILVKEIHESIGIPIKFVNLGGGIGVPYRPDDVPIDYKQLSAMVESHYNEIIKPIATLHPMRVVYENGRCITGPAGVLVTRVIHQKETYKHFVGIDGGMQNLMRPSLYGSYHHMTIIPSSRVDENSFTYKTILPKQRNLFGDIDTSEAVYDVVGGLCENNDKLAIDRRLGKVDIGDILVVHDTGAHGHAMGNNYNGVRRSAELLLDEGGKIREIRRAEELTDVFSTLKWPQGVKRRGCCPGGCCNCCKCCDANVGCTADGKKCNNGSCGCCPSQCTVGLNSIQSSCWGKICWGMGESSSGRCLFGVMVGCGLTIATATWLMMCCCKHSSKYR